MKWTLLLLSTVLATPLASQQIATMRVAPHAFDGRDHGLDVIPGTGALLIMPSGDTIVVAVRVQRDQRGCVTLSELLIASADSTMVVPFSKAGSRSLPSRSLRFRDGSTGEVREVYRRAVTCDSFDGAVTVWFSFKSRGQLPRGSSQ